jgi:hypothetical protein
LPAQVPAGTVLAVAPLRLHPQRIPRYHHGIGQSAAALGAAETQILQRHITTTGVDNRL